MSKEIFNVVSEFKGVADTSERYVIAAIYLLFLQHLRSLDQIENIEFRVGDIMGSIGLGFGWDINLQISEFIRDHRADDE